MGRWGITLGTARHGKGSPCPSGTGEGEPRGPRLLAHMPSFCRKRDDISSFQKPPTHGTTQLHRLGQKCPRIHPDTKSRLNKQGLGKMRTTVTPKHGHPPQREDSGTYPLGGRTPRLSERGSHGHLQACVLRAWGSAPTAHPGLGGRTPVSGGAGRDRLSSRLFPPVVRTACVSPAKPSTRIKGAAGIWPLPTSPGQPRGAQSCYVDA